MGIVSEIHGHDKDLGGGLRVRRLLPSLARQSVGPFLFFDHFGPVTLEPGANIDVRPHPHIGLATVTYLFDGALMHRDSLGNATRIEPGAINWMHAGRGIVHSERRPDELRGRQSGLHGLQLWVALPQAAEDSPPAFTHTPADQLPAFTDSGTDVRVLVGRAFGRVSPVVTASATLYVSLRVRAGAAITLPPLANQLAVYPVDAEVAIDGRPLARGVLGVLDAARPARLSAATTAEVVLVGGDPPDGRRFMWWNFVASRKEKIVAAADAWASQRMGHIAGDSEFIPLPDKRPEL